MGHDTLDLPIVLLRGWAANASDPEHNTWKAVEEHLTQKGIPFIVPYYHRFASIEERANFAIGFIGRAYPSKQVHLIGHSLGGLVARAIAGRDDLPFKVLTVTTLGSPNRGLKYIVPIHTKGGSGKLATAIRRVFGTDFGALFDLSHSSMESFNARTQNNPAVKYFSWAGHIHRSALAVTPEFIPLFLFVTSAYKDSDGIVGIESARWDEDLGPGTHLGTEKLSHSTIVSVDLVSRTLPHLRAVELEPLPFAEKVKDFVAALPFGHRQGVAPNGFIAQSLRGSVVKTAGLGMA